MLEAIEITYFRSGAFALAIRNEERHTPLCIYGAYVCTKLASNSTIEAMVPKVFKTGKRFGPIQATNMVLQCWRILVVAVPLLIFSLSEQFVVAKVLDEDTSPCTNAVTIIDDPLLTDQLALARKT